MQSFCVRTDKRQEGFVSSGGQVHPLLYHSSPGLWVWCCVSFLGGGPSTLAPCRAAQPMKKALSSVMYFLGHRTLCKHKGETQWIMTMEGVCKVLEQMEEP